MKKCLAIVLSLAMCLGLCTGFALADEKKSYNIVSFGDSTAIGYGLEDYGLSKTYYSETKPYGDDKGSSDNGCGTGIYDFSSAKAFPTLIGDYVQQILGERYKVNAVNLGMEGSALSGDPSHSRSRL